MTKAFTLAEQAEPVLDYCPVRSPDRDCSLSMLRIRAKSAAPIILCFTQAAFTLAEVLITLAIIGVVAAMTIPTLVADFKEKQTVTKVKHAYSVISQAYQAALNDYGDPTNWGYPDDMNNPDTHISIANHFKEFMKLSADCTGQDDDYCNSKDKKIFASIVLANGTPVSFRGWRSACNMDWLYKDTCGMIEIDTNGAKKPNKPGEDKFNFFITKDAIVPFGIKDSHLSFENGCNKNIAVPYPSYDGTSNLYTCTAWIIVNENTDYLNCPGELSWSGKTKCK